MLSKFNPRVATVGYATSNIKGVIRFLRICGKYADLTNSKPHYGYMISLLVVALRWLRRSQREIESLEEELDAAKAMTRLWRDKYTAKADECEQRRQCGGQTEEEMDVAFVAYIAEMEEK